MNQLHITNYNIKHESAIITEISRSLTPYSRYVIIRGSNKIAHLAVTLETNYSFTGLLKTKNSIERYLEALPEHEGLQHGKVQLMKEHLSFKNKSFIKCTYAIKYDLQSFLTDTYLYLKLFNPKAEQVQPIIMYQMAKVFNQYNLLRKDQFYDLLLDEIESKGISNEKVEALELEHAAFLSMMNKACYRLCISINKQAESYLRETCESTNYKSHVIERHEIVKQLIKNIYTHIFSFLNSNRIETAEHLQHSYYIAQQKNIQR